MKRFFIHIVAVSTILSSCGVSSSDYDRAIAERDAMAQEADSAKTQLIELQKYVQEVSDCVDSITLSEGMLMINRDPESGRPYTRMELRDRVQNFAGMVGRQRQRIAALNDSLRQSASPAQMKRLMVMVDYLNAQLEAKEEQLNRLRDELAASNSNVARLSNDLNTARSENADLSRRNEDLDNTVTRQTQKMNEGYLLVASKKKLEEMGILKGGFLKRAELKAANINVDNCETVDIRYFHGRRLDSKKARLLTQAPPASYTFEKEPDGQMRLVILDSNAFWSLSKVAIVQL